MGEGARRCGKCGAPLPAAGAACPRCLLDAELPPAMLGDRIELHEEIGSGGMGVVFRARHLGLDREVAVKVLPAELQREPGFAERFEREGRAMARLSHPRIVGVHDSGRIDDVSYIVMELVRGGSLSSAVPLPLERALEVALEVCDALAYAHGLGVVHRDVKPDNVLLDGDGHVKLGDFGIAALHAPGDRRATLPGIALGTPGYMAPESLSGAPPDPRMDVYSVGALLHEMILGRPPAGTIGPLPPGVDAIVRRALAPDPTGRYATIDELRSALLGGSSEELSPDERAWVRAVALVETVASASVLYALLASVTPRIIAAGDVPPLTVTSLEPLADGRLVSWARFETGPILAAIAAIAAGIAAYGLLVRHWRRSGYLTPHPDRPLGESGLVLAFGITATTVAALRHILMAWGISSPYAPILGGLIEVACLYVLWLAILEARRVARPLSREPRLHVGLALFLLPPMFELWLFLDRWRP